MLMHPNINPIAFQLGPLKVHWYGLMYLLSFIVGWFLVNVRAKKISPPWHQEKITDLIFYVALGVVLGGRIGYMLFYALPSFIHQPWIIFEVWRGGMSFHGGFLGVLLAVLLWGRRYRESFFAITDFIAPIIPIGLAAGRIGNFINGYLWGRVTEMPWGMVFPLAGPLPRHPSELYECFLEGILLFIILWWFSRKPRPRMMISGLFLFGYGCARCFSEFFRVPDPQLGYLAWGWLTMGQVLSFPMVVAGLFLLWRSAACNNT